MPALEERKQHLKTLRTLTPVTLELGGKSPVIIADIIGYLKVMAGRKALNR